MVSTLRGRMRWQISCTCVVRSGKESESVSCDCVEENAFRVLQGNVKKRKEVCKDDGQEESCRWRMFSYGKRCKAV